MKGVDPGGGDKPQAVDPFAIRLLKRTFLMLVGPFYFFYIAFAPLLCSKKSRFRGWYWRAVKQALSRLSWVRSFRTVISIEDLQTLSDDTNSIIVINHRSDLDGFALMDVMPDQKWITFAAKKELCEATLLRNGFTGAGLVEIDRKSGKLAMETLKQEIRAMPARRSVVLFPEGTRARTSSLGDFKAGAVVAARETGRGIRPIVTRGSDDLLARGDVIPKSGAIKIYVLPLFICDSAASVDEDVARLRTAMLNVFSFDQSATADIAPRAS